MGLFSTKKKELIPEVQQNSYQPHSQQSQNQQYVPSSSSQSIRSEAPSYRTTASRAEGGYIPPSQGGNGYSSAGSGSRWSSQQQGGQSQSQQQPQRQAEGGGRDWNSPNQASSSSSSAVPGGGRYGDSRGRGNGYGSSRDRNELLSGAGAYAASGGSQDRYGGPSERSQSSSNYGSQQEQRESGGNEEEEEEVEGIKQQLRFTKQESLASTRNALRIAQEAEETSRATLDRLGDQSDRIANTERHLDLAKAHNERAQDETKELESLNRSIFRPTFTFNKNRKRDAEELRILNRHNAEKAEREETRRDQYESRTRIESTYSSMDRSAENASGARMRAKARGAERGRYQFEATESDDEVEDEIDANLDEMSGVVGRLKLLAMTAGNEVEAQNAKLSKLGGKVDELDNGVHKSTARLARVK